MKKVLLVAILCCSAALASAQQITIAAAADLSSVLPEVASRFEKQTGAQVKVSFGSSGQITQQIENGSPVDLFFSADVSYPQHLESEGLTEPGTVYRYAVGKLVLYVPKNSPLNLSLGLHALLSPEAKHIAIANPKTAPYGRAAVEALKNEGLYDALQPKYVLGENISQTAQFVQSGAADAGILALSLVVGPEMKNAGRYVELPAADYTPLEQAVVVIKSSKNKPTAERFIDFVRKPEIVRLMGEYGFTLPGAAK